MNDYRYNPINTLKTISDDIWVVDGNVVDMDLKVLKFPFPTRMEVIRLTSGELFINSPVDLNDKIKSQLENLGKIKYIVAPNKIHYTYMKQWHDAYPDADFYGVAGIKERASEQGITICPYEVIEQNSFDSLNNDLKLCLFKGSSFMDEAVFFHGKSKTLILADLIENFEYKKVGLLKYLALKFVGATAPNGKAPKDYRFTFHKGMEEARKSKKMIEGWDFDRIIMAHGKIIESKGKDFFYKSFDWVK